MTEIIMTISMTSFLLILIERNPFFVLPLSASRDFFPFQAHLGEKSIILAPIGKMHLSKMVLMGLYLRVHHFFTLFEDLGYNFLLCL